MAITRRHVGVILLQTIDIKKKFNRVSNETSCSIVIPNTYEISLFVIYFQLYEIHEEGKFQM